MIFAICHLNDDLTGEYEVYSLRYSFSKKVAHSSMYFQTCTFHVLHWHTDENRWIFGYILHKSWQLKLNHIWPSTYWMIEVQLLLLASNVAQYRHPLKTEWLINWICLLIFQIVKSRFKFSFSGNDQGWKAYNGQNWEYERNWNWLVEFAKDIACLRRQ